MKTLKPNRNNIETYLPIFTGFYESIFEPDFETESEYYGLPENFDFFKFFDYSKWHAALSKYFCDCVESAMSEFIEAIEFQSLCSPREYNFSSDSINCIIRPKKKAIQTYIYEHKRAFEKYLEEHLKSRDGFHSFHSYSFEDWEINTQKFKSWDKSLDSHGFNLGFVLEFIADNEELNERDVFDDFSIEVSQSEYLNEDFYKLIEDFEGNQFVNMESFVYARQNGYKIHNLIKQIEIIKAFVRDNYLKLNVAELTLSKFESEPTGYLDTLADYLYIDKIIAAQMQEIESKTLELAL